MLFSQKSNGYYAEVNEHGILLARTSAPVVPFTVEEVRECPLNDPAALQEAISQIQPKKSPSGYLHATVSIYPAKRLVRRHSLDLKRMKEPEYFAELCMQQFRIDQDKYTIALLNASDGIEFDASKGDEKDVVLGGLPNEEVASTQSSLLENSIYPERLELGTLATLGGLADFLSYTKSNTPTLILEIGTDITHSFIVSSAGVEASRPIPQGSDAMVPIVQKELGLKDEESARRLFYSNTFDFTGMGPLLIKKLLKELQGSIGFYEVSTGQSVVQLRSTQFSPKLAWLEGAIATSLGISRMKLDPVSWLQARHVTIPEALIKTAQDIRWFGLLALMVQPNAVHAVTAEEKK